MANPKDELEELRARVAALTARIYRLEQAAGLGLMPPPREPAQPATPAIPVPQSTPPPVAKPGPAPVARPESLESKIGAQWLNRIGIVAVLIGVSYFLKYAFENDWIGEAGRVAIGLLAGIGVLVWSEGFRRRGHQRFSLSLKAVGIGVLYLSLWASFQLYHLVPAAVAFVAMVLVTASTATLALRQDAQLLAAFALAGGFATPLLLSTGQNRPLELFSYVALLDAATVVLIAYRPWQRLLAGSFLGTLVLYVGWNSQYYTPDQLGLALFFTTLFFLIFAAAPLVQPAPSKEERAAGVPASGTLTVITLLNASAYFLAAYDLLEYKSSSPIAWIAVGLAAIYLVLARHLRRQVEAEGAPAPLISMLHAALAVGFLTIAIPLKLDHHWITIGWFVEAGVLLWIADRGKSVFLRNLSIAALALGVFRLLAIDNFYSQHLLFNWRFATYGVAIAVLAGIAILNRRRGDEGLGVAVPLVAINLLALVALHHEVSDFFSQRMSEAALAPGSGPYPGYNLAIAREFTHSAVWMVYGAGLMAAGFWKRSAFLRWQALLLMAVTVVKVFTYDVSQLDRGYRIVSFIALGVILLGVSYVYQRDWLQLSRRGPEGDAAQGAEGNPPPA